jgi:hypothetical protein
MSYGNGRPKLYAVIALGTMGISGLIGGVVISATGREVPPWIVGIVTASMGFLAGQLAGNAHHRPPQ